MRKSDIELEVEILKILIEKRKIHYSELTSLGIGMETARRYCIQLSKKYPDYIIYTRGMIIMIGVMDFDKLPLEARLEWAKKTLDQKEETERKLRTNHLPHLEKAILEGNLEKIKKELERLREIFPWYTLEENKQNQNA
jgi:hypothetical protein